MTLSRSVIEQHERMMRDEIEELLETPMGLADGERWSVDRENVRALVRGADPGPHADPFAEAIIRRHQRPSLLVRNGRIEVPRSRIWRRRLMPHRADIERAIPGVGRIEFANVPGIDYVGTGWLIDEDVVVTNRHVASVFAERVGKQIFRYVPVHRLGGDLDSTELVKARIDFREEFEASEEHNADLGEILWIEGVGPGLPDLALIKLRRPVTDLAPLVPQTSLRDTDYVGVIGYPASDHRATPSAMDQVFGDIFDKKRFAPGLVMGRREVVIRHDCSTLGGNSGSPVIDVDTGHVVALHYGGREGVGNNAVSIEVVVDRLAKLSHAVPVGRTFSEIMEREEPLDAGSAERERRSSVFSASALWKRSGYQPAFLGDGPDHEVPFPLPPDGDREHVLEVRSGMPGPRRYLLPYEHYSVAMHAERKLPICTAVNIDGDTLRRLSRKRHARDWTTDPRIGDDEQIDNALYRHNSLDRGHMVRRLDPAWGEHVSEAILANKDTFFYTNCAPQHADLNQGLWVRIEDHVLDELTSDRGVASVFTGPLFRESDLVYRGVQLPESFWKVVAFLDAEGRLRSGAFTLTQDHLLAELEALFDAYVTHQVPVAQVQEESGLDFGPLVDADRFGGQETVTARRRLERLEDMLL